MAAKRVLVFGMTENPGGVESFLKNYYVHMDRESIQFDFLCNSYNPIAYEQEFAALGGRMFHFPPRHSHPIGFRRELKKFFAAHAGEYEAIWVNVNSLANIDYLKFALRYGIGRRIVHSHNSENMDSGLIGRIRGLLHRMNRRKITRYATDFWACSEGAADYFYAGIRDESGELRTRARVIHNAIEVSRMAFDAQARSTYRKEIGAKDTTVVWGNVGRLHFQKNQEFLLDWFAAYHKQAEDSLLVMIGAGEDEEKLRNKATELGITGSVLMPGIRKDVPQWMSAFDLFAFPSVFEGVSLVGLEAQANGLPIYASEKAIPEEARLCDERLCFDRLERGAEAWAAGTARFLSEVSREVGGQARIERIFAENGYCIENEAICLQNDLLNPGK